MRQTLISLLRAEVRPALGCTEPAAAAFAVAKARDFLGGDISRVNLAVSENVFKNALAVTIPNTTEAGLPMAALLGLLKGDPQKGLAVFESVVPTDVDKATVLNNHGVVTVLIKENENDFYIAAEVTGQRGSAKVVLSGGHTNIVKVELNGDVLINNEPVKRTGESDGPFALCTVEQLVKEVESLPSHEIAFLQDGLEMNRSIALLGLASRPGMALGAEIQSLMGKGIIGNDVVNRARMLVAGACDARMAGMNHPVMSSMGSGNLGIMVILTVATMAEEIEASEEKTLRALALSHLVTGFVKQRIGRLSNMCGSAVAAGSGAAAAITWLYGGSPQQISGAIQNIIGNLAGMICDGAKGGCALKLSTSAAEAILSSQLALRNRVISPRDGIISLTVEETIRNLGRLGTEGMDRAGKTIVDIMLQKTKKAM